MRQGPQPGSPEIHHDGYVVTFDVPMKIGAVSSSTCPVNTVDGIARISVPHRGVAAGIRLTVCSADTRCANYRPRKIHGARI